MPTQENNILTKIFIQKQVFHIFIEFMLVL
jgi:hypothetical protein